MVDGASLPAATQVGAVRLQVADLERSLAWYGGVLGFGVQERAEGRVALVADHSGADADGGSAGGLIELVERTGSRPAPQRGRLGLYHFAVLLPDRAALGRLVQRLAERHVPAGSADHLVSEALYLNDPDGLGLEIYADRPRESWRRNGDELVMDSRPLDVPGLVRAAGGEEWAGIPAGTTIGHVHLHVGSIPQARVFYRDLLGLEITVSSYPGALFLSAGGYHHHLGVNTWAGRGATPPGPEDAQLLQWELVLPERRDVEAVAGRLEAAGIEVAAEGREVRAADPWGTRLVLSPRD